MKHKYNIRIAEVRRHLRSHSWVAGKQVPQHEDACEGDQGVASGLLLQQQQLLPDSALPMPLQKADESESEGPYRGRRERR